MLHKKKMLQHSNSFYILIDLKLILSIYIKFIANIEYFHEAECSVTYLHAVMNMSQENPPISLIPTFHCNNERIIN